MELASKFTIIEEIKGSIQRYFFVLKKELKDNGSISSIKKQKAMNYANKMLEEAEQEFFSIKLQIDAVIKTDRLARQLVRNISSIKTYRQKIDEICNL